MSSKAAIYARLSRDDTKAGESESISNQKSFLRRYAAEQGMEIVCELADDGVSGTSFNRAGFNQLLLLIEEGQIDTVLTKDLSRLGRDYIQTGYYLEQYFPLHRVRYIAVNDGIDTGCEDSGNELSPFRAVLNDLYAKDISKKVRTALYIKKKEGQFIGSSAPFGYKKAECDKNRLEIDPAAAEYVRLIYRSFLCGNSLASVCAELSERKIPTPAVYKGQRPDGRWSSPMVRRILSNPTYCGNLTQNMTKKINYKVNRKICLPRSEWITVTGTHEGIISYDVFKRAEKLLKSGEYKNENRGQEHLLSGLVFCAGCGSRMSFIRESTERSYLVCSRWRREGQKSGCRSHCIREAYVEATVCERLQGLFLQANRKEVISGGKVKTAFAGKTPERHVLKQFIEKIEIGTQPQNTQKEIRIHFRFKNPAADS